MTLTWTDRSSADLEAIAAYIAQDNPYAADRLILKIVNRMKQLSSFPRRGRVVPEYGQEELRETIVGNYRVIYRLSDDFVEVLTVFEGHRQLRDDDIAGK
jgi:plasmid stabilization system protein ParE